MTVELGQVFDFLAFPALQPTALEVLLSLSGEQEIINALREDVKRVQALVSLVKHEMALKVLVNVCREESVTEMIWQCISQDLNERNQTVKYFINNQYGRMLLCNLSKQTACKEYLVLHHLKDILAHSNDLHSQYILIELSTTTKLAVFEAIKNYSYDDFFASVCKNILFDTANHEAVLSSLDYTMLTSVSSPSVTFLEMCLLLCTTLPGRTRLRECNLYEVLKQAHLESTDNTYREMVERVVEYLIRDEEPV